MASRGPHGRKWGEVPCGHKYRLDQQLMSDFMRMGIWTPFSRSPSTIQVIAMAGTLKIVFPSGNDNSKFSRISTTMECNSITLSN